MNPSTKPVSLASRLLYRWIIPTVQLARKRQLAESDLEDVPFFTPATHDAAAFEALRAGTSRSLARAIVTNFPREILHVFALSMVLLCSNLAGPLLLRNLLASLDNSHSIPVWFSDTLSSIGSSIPSWAYPVASTLALAINSLFNIFLVHRLFFVQPIFARRVRALLGQIVFDKTLRLERSSRQHFSSGFVMNLMSTDLLRVDWFLIFAHATWYYPLTLACAVALLYNFVGVPALWGCLTLLLILSLSVGLSRLQTLFRKQINELSDLRVGLTRETLLHSKAAKLQGWEGKLAAKIQSIRSRETGIARKLIHVTSSLSFLSTCAPALAMAVTTISMVDAGTALRASTLFPVLSLFTLLRFAMSQLPDTIYNLIEAALSLGRIQKFLDAPEYTRQEPDTSMHEAVRISDLRCYWPNGSLALEIDTLTIERGELVVIVGGVGAGKSTLLLSMLGEFKPQAGSVALGGEVSYVSQNPWIISESIKTNITCGGALDPERYRIAVRASGLGPDLAALPHGDATQIGERGINLSGGQRHRVALARALYCGGEIYLFDDPLSALDPGVANHVFTQMILGELSSATRVVVSHRVEYALAADRVIVVENGRIREQGPPQDLRRDGTRFSELLAFHEQVSRDSAQAISHTPPPEASRPHQDEAEEIDEALQAAPTLIVSEERVVGAVARSTTRDYLKRLAPGVVGLFLVSLFILRQGSGVATDLWLTLATRVDSIPTSLFIKGYLLSIFVLCIVAYLRAASLFSRGLQAGLDCHERLLKGVLHAPMRFFESNPVGRILNRFSRDLETVEMHLPRAILDAGSCLCDTIAILFVIAWVAPLTLVVALPVFVAYILLFKVYRPVSRDLQRLTATTLSPIFAVLSECLNGIETLRAAGLQSRFSQRFAQVVDRNARTLIAQTGVNRWLGVRLELLGLLIMSTVGLVIALRLDSMLGVAFSGLVLTYANSITGAMNWAVRSLAMVENSLTSFERIERYAETVPEATGGVVPPPGWPSRGAITLHDFSVRYRPELPLALSRVSFCVEGGTRVGIIGRTGSGKSTLILALMRLLEAAEGYIEIDGINLSTVALDDLRGSIVVVPQEPVLFSGTLRESLDPFDACSDEEIHAALKRVELWPLFSSLPEGLATSVHEGGFNFSSGQRQLICLARALLRQSKVIVLDEATASIDVQTDYAIQRAIREEFRDSTVLVIAHRLGTVLDSDLMIALRDGVVAEVGRPAELLTDHGSILSQFVSEAQRQKTPYVA